jgi:hypothetical protein
VFSVDDMKKEPYLADPKSLNPRNLPDSNTQALELDLIRLLLGRVEQFKTDYKTVRKVDFETFNLD